MRALRDYLFILVVDDYRRLEDIIVPKIDHDKAHRLSIVDASSTMRMTEGIAFEWNAGLFTSLEFDTHHLATHPCIGVIVGSRVFSSEFVERIYIVILPFEGYELVGDAPRGSYSLGSVR